MSRKKVDLTYITKASKRKTTFKKRKNGLIKKIDELTTLCGIEAFAIIYSPDEPQPEVWPSESGIQSVISRFRGVPELEQSKKMLNQESFLRKAIMKGLEQLKKLRNENRKREMTLLMFQHLNQGINLGNLNIIDFNDIMYLINQSLDDIIVKINMRQGQEVTPVVGNGGESTMPQGEQVFVNYVPMPHINVDVMQNLNWDGSINTHVGGGGGSINTHVGGGGDNMLTLEDVNVQSGWLNHFIP